MAVSAGQEMHARSAAEGPGRVPLPSGPELTFVFTDIERSTALLERLGGAYGDVLAMHAELVRTLLEQRGGHEVDTQGDAFFLVFSDPGAALLFAADVQRRLVVEAWPQDARVRLRIGIHTGSAELRRTGYVGMDVHKGARVAAAGHGGQVLVTATTAAGLGAGPPVDLVLQSLGTFHLKDIREPVELLELAGPGLESSFPPPRTLDEVDEPPTPGEPPYLGLAPFGEADAERFFGREALVERLLTRLDDVPFLAVVGASGSGKSSLVRAGLVPALRARLGERDGGMARIAVVTPGEDPMGTLDAALDGLAGPPATIVVDQLEELFTLVRDEAMRTAFVDRLLELLDAGAGLVIALRADFYDRLAAFDRLRTLAAEHQEYLGPLSHDELRQAIEGPAELGGWRFDPGLVDLILHDVGNEPGALPLLSHAIRETWARRRGTLLTLRGYLDSGGVQGGIARTADATVGALEGSDLTLARDILLRLTELGEEAPDTRRRASLEELVSEQRDPGAAQAVLDRLVAARLVVLEGAGAEVAHEALIREWPTLRGWLEDDRETLRLHRLLTLAARDWDASGRDPSLLLRGARLAQAREWLAGAASATALERALVDASIAAERSEAAEREAVRERELEAARALAASEASAATRLRRRALALGGLLVMAVALAGFSFLQLQRADEATVEARSAADLALEREGEAVEARDLAQEQRRLALSRQLAAQSGALSGDLDRSVLLALEAGQVADTVESRSSLLAALGTEPRLTAFLEHDLPFEVLEFGADGRTLVGQLRYEGLAARWDAETGRRLTMLRAEDMTGSATGFVSSMAITPDGRTLAFVEDDAEGTGGSTVVLWDLERADRIGDHPVAGWVRSMLFSPDGETLGWMDDAGLRLWTLGDDEPALLLPPEPAAGRTHARGPTSNLVFSPDGSRVAAAFAEDPEVQDAGVIAVWDVATGELTGPPIESSIVAFSEPTLSPDGEILAMIDQEPALGPDGEILPDLYQGSIALWRTATGESIAGPAGLEFPVNDLAIGGEGTILAVGSIDRPIRLWDIEHQQLLDPPLAGHRNGLMTMAFAPDGRTMASGGWDGTVLLWDIGRVSRVAETVVASDADDPPIVEFSPRADAVAIGLADGTIRVASVAEGGSFGEPFPAHMERVRAIAFSPDGRVLASAGGDGAIRTWDPQSGTQVGGPAVTQEPLPEPIEVIALAFSPDGSTVVSSSRDGMLRRWDPATGDPIGEPNAAAPPDGEDGSENVSDIVFSPDGRLYATAGAKSSVLWDAGTHTQVGESLRGHEDSVISVAFSPDGRRLAAADARALVFLWDVETGTRIGEPLLHEDLIEDVAFSPDGRLVAAAVAGITVEEGTVVLWDTESGRRLGEPLPVPNPWRVAFAPDGDLLSMSGNGTVVRWDLDETRWAELACTIAGRDLTPGERATYIGDESAATNCARAELEQ